MPEGEIVLPCAPPAVNREALREAELGALELAAIRRHSVRPAPPDPKTGRARAECRGPLAGHLPDSQRRLRLVSRAQKGIRVTSASDDFTSPIHRLAALAAIGMR
jgi:hypothetical protein